MFDAHKNRRTAVIGSNFKSFAITSLIKEDWKIVDLDAFFDNLSMWHQDPINSAETIKLLFSSPIDGIRQNLVNQTDLNVGIAGKRIDEIKQHLIDEYNKKGYDVLVLTENVTEKQTIEKVRFIPSNSKTVYLNLKK